MYTPFKGQPPDDAHGALRELRAPCGVLEAIAGAPEDDLGDKVSTAWCFQCQLRPDVFLIVRDLCDEDDRTFSRDRFRAQLAYDWHVTGRSEAEVTAFCQWLSAEVIRRVQARGAARRLTADSRGNINALVQEGMLTAEAMKRAAVWEDTRPSAAEFAWPIVR